MYGYILNPKEGRRYLDWAYDLWSNNEHRSFRTGVLKEYRKKKTLKGKKEIKDNRIEYLEVLLERFI